MILIERITKERVGEKELETVMKEDPEERTEEEVGAMNNRRRKQLEKKVKRQKELETQTANSESSEKNGDSKDWKKLQSKKTNGEEQGSPQLCK